MMSSAVTMRSGLPNLLPTAVQSPEYASWIRRNRQTGFRLCAAPGGTFIADFTAEPVAAPGHGEIAVGWLWVSISSEYAPVPDGNRSGPFRGQKVATHFRTFHYGGVIFISRETWSGVVSKVFLIILNSDFGSVHRR